MIYSARVWVALLILMAGPIYAAQRTWDGGGTDWDWRNSANWNGTIRLDPIEQGDTLVFPEGPTKLINTNDFGANTNFSALIYSGDDYQTYGNRIGLSNGVSVTHASGATALHLPILLRRDQTFSVSSANAFLHVYGEVNIGIYDLTFEGAGGTVLIGEIVNNRLGGRGTIRKTGSGRLTIFQQTDHDAPTIVSGGILAVEHRMTNSTVTVQSGGTLRGSGRIGGLNAVGGLVHPGGTSPNALECRGDASLAAGSTLRIRLNGTTAGVTYDQLDVVGTVTLGGTLELVFGYTPAVGDRFTIIENDGSEDVVGTFAGLPDRAVFTANGRPFRISYGSGFGLFRDNDVTVEAIPADVIWDAGGDVNNLWSQPLNWSGDVIPFPGDNIQMTNRSFSRMVTSNDFPAGRLFGSMVLGGYDQWIIGNAAQFDGPIVVAGHPFSSARYDIDVPVTLAGGIIHSSSDQVRFLETVNLSQNQTFRFEQPGSRLQTFASILLNGHTLRFHMLSNTLFSLPDLREPIVGPGAVIKSGPAMLALSNDVSAPITVEDGTLILDGAAVSGLITVESGGVLQSSGGLQALEVQSGGTFAPSRFQYAGGDVSLMSGSTLSISVYSYTANGQLQTSYGAIGVGEGRSIDITGCNLDLQINPNTNPDAAFAIVRAGYNDHVTGTFAGLPEGAMFAEDNRLFTITYRGGEDGDLVIVSPITVFTWDGGGAGANWSTPANWAPDFVPVANNHLVFGGATSKRAVVNDLAAGTSFRSLRFDAAGYAITGNHFKLSDALACYVTGEALINADLSVSGGSDYDDNFFIDVADSATLRIEGAFSGYYARKRGPGTLRMGGAAANSTFSTFVEAGVIELAKAGSNALTGDIAIEGGSIRLLEDDQIGDSGTLSVTGAGRLELNGQREVIDNLTGDGTVELAERALRTARLTVKRGNFSGRFTGFGTFVKSGFGPLVLTGVNPFLGLTLLEQGELRMDNVQTNSTIRLDGGLLTGRGYVGAITANLGGTLAPGFGGPQYESALHARDVTLNGNTTFRTVLTSSSPDFEGHKLQVAGTVNLGGSALVIDVYSNFKPTNAANWIIIENDGTDPITGTFAGLAEGGTVAGEGWLFRISYTGGTGNDVTLTRVAPPVYAFGIEKVSHPDYEAFNIRGQGMPGLRYKLQTTGSLNPVIQWGTIEEIVAGTDGIFERQLFYWPGFTPHRFFRVVSP